MKKIHVLNTSDGYEALYVNGILYDEGSTLGEGGSRLYFLKLREDLEEKNNIIITSNDIWFGELSEADEAEMDNWPNDITEFHNSYEQS